METTTILIFLLVVVSILLIGIILIQSGQGDMGSAMGGNTMNQAFGSQGADKLLVRVTTGLAVIFMVLAIFIQREQVAAPSSGGVGTKMQKNTAKPEIDSSNQDTNTNNKTSDPIKE